MNLLTIVVPTYNRREAVIFNSIKLIESGILSKVNYLVLDNASPDGTYEHLSSLFQNIDNATVKRNDSNLGFFGNFLKCFEEARTKFILISSDEDEVIAENIEFYLDYLEEYNPAFSSSVVLKEVDNKTVVHKGQESKRKISISELRSSCFYASGLGFKRNEAGKYINAIKEHQDNEMVFLYPMLALCSILLAKNSDCLWFDQPLHKMKYILPTEIRTSSGSKHYHLESRVKQMRGYKNFIDEAATTASSNEEKHIYRELILQHYTDFFSLIRHALRQEEDGDIIRCVDNAGMKFYFRMLIKDILKGKFKEILKKIRR